MDINSLMKQAKQMQEDIKSKNEKFFSEVFEFDNNDIKITITGKKEIKKILIDDKYLSTKEKMQDYLILEINNAISKVDNKYKELLGPLAENAPTDLF